MAIKTTTHKKANKENTAAVRLKADIDKHERQRQPISWTCWAVKTLSEGFISTLKNWNNIMLLLRGTSLFCYVIT